MGIHSLMSLLLADVCYEFDLHLASYHLSDSDLYGTAENLAWLPEGAQGICGEDGVLAFVEAEFFGQMDAAIQDGLNDIAEICNDEEMGEFMRCDEVTIVYEDGGNYVAQVVDYTDTACGDENQTCGAFFYSGLLGDATRELKVVDVDFTVIEQTDLSDPDANQDLVACIQSMDPAFATLSNDDQQERIRHCYNSIDYFTLKSFRECATDCIQEDLRTKTAEAVVVVDSATDLFENIEQIYDVDAEPMLKCMFVSEIVADIFIPLCQETYGGITLIVFANYMAGVGLLISLPIGVMATKRFKYGNMPEEDEKVLSI